MLRFLWPIILIMGLFSCSTYKIAERHLNKKMGKANLSLSYETLESGDSIEYWDSKDTLKPNLLLVHGFGASTKYQWYKQVKLLSQKYRVIAPNLNYFGRTVPAEANYKVIGQVETLEKLLAHLNVDTCTIMGVSYGGLIGAELAKKTSVEVPQMVLLDTPTKFADSTDISNVKSYFDTPSIEELFVPTEPAGLKKLLFLATGKNRNIPSRFLEEFHEKSYRYNLDDKRALISALMEDMNFYKDREYDFDMPILLIWGAEDKVVPLSTGEQLKEYFGENAQLKVINGAAHMPNMTHAREFNRYIETFLGITK